MRVHVVDDNETNLMLFSQLVRGLDSGLEVQTFLDPYLSVESCRSVMPDLVLVDYMMPGMDGHEYIATLRAMAGAAEVPIVMVTAADERSVRHRALELGATDFIAKPVDPAEVKARLRNLLALRKTHLRLKDRNSWLREEISKATQTIVDRELELIWRMAKAAEYRDPETGSHILRMAHYSQLVAREMGLSEEECDLLLHAAPMHDVGKMGIPDGILLKPGKLDEEEFRMMKQHAEIGYSILQDSSSRLIQVAAEIAKSHHEKFDGSGYPAALAGEDIPLFGRIVAVADVFDALTSVRPYKTAWPVAKARAFLQESAGSHFDPRCVAAFMARWDEILAVRETFFDKAEEISVADI
jgi:putative two-component system response regulator